MDQLSLDQLVLLFPVLFLSGREDERSKVWGEDTTQQMMSGWNLRILIGGIADIRGANTYKR